MSIDYEAKFLQAIHADPDNGSHGSPRMVYADWLEEQGDPRAALVRLSAQIRRFPKGVVFHCRQFEYLPYFEAAEASRSVLTDIDKETGASRWWKHAVMPCIQTEDEYPGWWMWNEQGHVFSSKEFRRQVYAITKLPPVVSVEMPDVDLPDVRRVRDEILSRYSRGASERIDRLIMGEQSPQPVTASTGSAGSSTTSPLGATNLRAIAERFSQRGVTAAEMGEAMRRLAIRRAERQVSDDFSDVVTRSMQAGDDRPE